MRYTSILKAKLALPAHPGAAARARDRRRIYAAAFLRAVATGLIGVLLGIYLASLSLDAKNAGLLVAVGLAGATVAVAFVTFAGNRCGRRRLLIVHTVLSAAGALVLAFHAHMALLLPAVFLGMVNGMGRDRGAALVLEQAMLPATTSDEHRTAAFARYNALQDIGHALGSLLAAVPWTLESAGAADSHGAVRASMLFYAMLSVLPLFAYVRLSAAVESPLTTLETGLAPESRRRLQKIAGLFALDGFGGGFLTTALVAYFFHLRFGVSAASVGILFFTARIANAVSHLAAARLARRFGLVNTMVFTHLPSSVLLMTVAIAPSFEIAAALFLLREALVEMDVPTRQSYVMAVVRAEERTFASGVTHLVRLTGWALAPAIAGMAMDEVSLMVPLLIGAALKIAYDLLLWRAFRSLKPPEERRAAAAGRP